MSRIFPPLLIAAVALGCSSGSSAPGDGGVPPSDAGDLPDGAGPQVDTPPTLQVDEPPRASWVTDASVSVTGTATDDREGLGVTVNGAPASTDASGAFRESVTTNPGVLILDTTATDSAGNSTTDTRAVLAGTFLPYGDPATRGIVVQLNEGEGGIGELEAKGATLVEADDLDALIVNPVYNDSSENCVDLCFFPLPPCPICVTWYAVTLNVTNPQLGGTQLVIDPQTNGQVRLEMTVSSPRFDWSASGTVAEIDASASGEILADAITIEMSATPMIGASGDVTLDITAVTALANGFVWDMSGFLGDVLSFFGADQVVADLIRDSMVDAIEDAVRSDAPALLEDALNGLAQSYELLIGDRAYAVDAIPSSVEVADTAITLSLATEVTVDETVHSGDLGLGSLYAEYVPPTWDTEPGMGVGFSGDFLNQLLLARWRGGFLDAEEAPPEALGIPAGAVLLVAPTATNPVLSTHANLPPVLVAGSGAHPYALQLGDLLVTLYEDTAAEGNEILQGWLSMEADFDVDVSLDGTLTPVVSNPRSVVDITLLPDPERGPESVEALLEALLPRLLDDLANGFGEVVLPSISGFRIDNATLRAGDSNTGFLSIEGELTGP